MRRATGVAVLVAAVPVVPAVVVVRFVRGVRDRAPLVAAAVAAALADDPEA